MLVYSGQLFHIDFLEALEKRDPAAARKAMRKHLENATEAAATHFNNPL